MGMLKVWDTASLHEDPDQEASAAVHSATPASSLTQNESPQREDLTSCPWALAMGLQSHQDNAQEETGKFPKGNGTPTARRDGC